MLPKITEKAHGFSKKSKIFQPVEPVDVMFERKLKEIKQHVNSHEKCDKKGSLFR